MADAQAGARAPDPGREEPEDLLTRQATSREKAAGPVRTPGVGHAAVYVARLACAMGGLASENQRSGGAVCAGSGV